MSERALAAVLESAMREAGFERLAFDTIVASGPHAALPHYRAGERILTAGDLLVLDFGGVLDGYCCDLTRTVSIGPPSAESRRLHDAVRAAQQAAIAAVRPGVDASAVDAAARSVLQARGLGEAFGHGTGHGLGSRGSRGTPDRASDVAMRRPSRWRPEWSLRSNRARTCPGFGGVRIEDDVLVTDTGCEVLTSVTRDLLTFE